MQELATDPPARPSAPYVGVRTYGFDETAIFGGREAEVAQVGALVARRARWRIVLLHGQTGCGKSSFLKAGLIPELTSPRFHTAVYDQGGDGAFTSFVNATDNPLAQIAGVAVTLAQGAVPAGEHAAWFEATGMAPDWAQAAPTLASEPGALVRWFETLAPRLEQPLLLVIDQAEEVFTLRVGASSERAVAQFFDFLAAYCERSTWIQFLISMRTEFYGRFDHELRRRLGPAMPVAPFYLQAFTAATLERAVTGPLDQVFRAPHGHDYRVEFEPGLPRALAERVAQRFPGPGALTCLQIVCVRLCEQALATLPPPGGQANALPSEPRVARVTRAMLDDIGAVEIVIEDLIDQAIGDFCDRHELRLMDATRLWRTTKDALGGLVTRQADGAPTTKFAVRGSFVAELGQQLARSVPSVNRWLLPSLAQTADDDRRHAALLVDHLLRPEVRVLREVRVAEPGQSEPTCYLALGHDVLSVGLAEAAARTAAIHLRQTAESRRFIVRLLVVPTLAAVLGGGATWLLGAVGGGDAASVVAIGQWGFGSLVVSLYAVMLWEAFSQRTNDAAVGWYRLVDAHVTGPSPAPAPPKASRWDWLWMAPPMLRLMGTRSRQTGQLFRALTDDKRREAAALGQAAFPGSARY